MHNYIQMNTPLTQKTILNTFIKSDISTPLLTLPKKTNKKKKKIQKSKIKCYLSNPQTICHILSIYFLHKKFVHSEIQTHFYIKTPYFLHFQIWTFWPHEPKNLNFTNSFLEHYPQPNWTKIAQKIQKWSSSWPWNCCTHTFGWPCL